MPYYSIRVQTIGTRLFACSCGAIGRYAVRPERARIVCRSCRGVFILGTAVYRVLAGGDGRPMREPADCAIPRQPGSVPDPLEQLGVPQSQRALYQDAQLRSRERAISAEEPTVLGGIYRSGQPVTLEMDVELNELWRDNSTGMLYLAGITRLGAGYVYVALEHADQQDAREAIGRREWNARASRVG